MTFKVDYLDDGVVTWESTDDGAIATVDETFRPTIYLAAEDWETLAANRALVDDHPNVVETARESWRRGFRHDHESMLRVDVADID
ncbi:MAG: type B DNA-directed DNA polymerase, partial [Halobacteriota archaeon]